MDSKIKEKVAASVTSVEQQGDLNESLLLHRSYRSCKSFFNF
jgi:hypothetical protein